MLDQLIEFLKRAVVEQEVNPLAGGHLAGGVLFLDARRAAALLGSLLALAQLIEFGLSLRFFLGHSELLFAKDQLTAEDREDFAEESRGTNTEVH